MAMENSRRRHTACDACRARKLKCSSELPRCSRCQTDSIECVYSAQKRMGRPRKRLRGDDGSVEAPLPAASAGSALRTPDLGTPKGIFDVFVNNGFPGIGDANAFAEREDERYPSPVLDVPYGLAQGPPIAPDPGLDLDALPPLDFPTPERTNAFEAPPTLLGAADGAPPTPPCACLSNIYLTLSALQSLTSLTFPFALQPLRAAKLAAAEVMHCPHCPTAAASAMQNTGLLSTLLTALVERFHGLLAAIDAEAARVEAAGGAKRLAVGDVSAESGHLHTGRPGCPARFSVELGAREWRRLAKRVVRDEVVGGERSVVGLLAQMERRQIEWHASPGFVAATTRLAGRRTPGEPDEYTCLRLIRAVRDMVDALQWS